MEASLSTNATEKPLTYKEYVRQYHEKDFAAIMDFVGRNKDFTTEESVKHLSFLEGHYNLLTTKESSIVLGKVNNELLQKDYPDLYERVRSNVEKHSPINEINGIVEGVKQRGGAWSFEDIRNVKTQETALLTRDHPSNEFYAMRYDYNKTIGYQLNATADIKVFMEDVGYKQKQSTERWPRYERGDTVLLVTENNGFKNVKTGETGNLFKFITTEHTKKSDMTATAHFIDVVMKQPSAEMRSKAHVEWLGERNQQSAKVEVGAPAVKKEFNLSEYRLEQLNTANNYLVNQRQIDKATLNSPVFKDSILQGNKTHRIVSGKEVEIPKYLNNVVYPFKTSPEARKEEMASLLQQYSSKFKVGEVMTDKLFAAGGGKATSAWFSNLPADGKVSNLFVVENPLDALSHYQLHKPENPLYMATGGRPAAGQLQLMDEVAKKHGAERVHLSFDNDMPGHSFDTQYLATKTPQVGLKQVADSKDKEFIVEFKQLKPEQEHALREAVKDNPNVKKDENGTVQVHVKTPEELAKCNKYAVEYLHNDKNLDFTKSQSKDWNDDLKAAKIQSMVQNQNRDLNKTQGKTIVR
jgi:hypothetical protein